MARYGKAFKERAVARLLPPESASVEEVSRRLCLKEHTVGFRKGKAVRFPDHRCSLYLAGCCLDSATVARKELGSGPQCWR